MERLLMLKMVSGAVIACGVALGSAATANADLYDTPPEPTTTDVSSGGTIGDSNLGVSWGTPVGSSGGYAAWAGPYRVENSGFPVSRFKASGPGFTFDNTTDYNYEGGVQQWSTYNSEMYSNHEYRELTPSEGYQQQQQVRWGSMQYKCTNHVCTMKGDAPSAR